ncbi:serine protease Hayan isoform X2 [Zeugodacus cucurbitae]|uniref:serine protease Hayan isoform X2 n=1 Tax=Zeugodacus cucurbitae TaxID=28588 RepID=UPI0023D96ED4|nr:serine protease Hayan isoform X2 [Zeugodacus cucurbitae]
MYQFLKEYSHTGHNKFKKNHNIYILKILKTFRIDSQLKLFCNMENKLIFLGLLFALLQATHAKEADPDPYLDDGSITIYVDAGKEIDNYLTLSKQIEKTQHLIASALERMSEEIKAMAKRISDQAKATEEKCNQQVTAEAKATEERLNQRVTAEAKATAERLNQGVTAEAKATEEMLNQRMSAEIKAIDEHWNEKISKMSSQQTQSISGKVPLLNQTVNELSNQPRKSSKFATPKNRPAEHACEKIRKDLRSIGLTYITGTPIYYFWLYTPKKNRNFCNGALIDKRFVLTLSDCFLPDTFIEVKLSFSSGPKGIKAIHRHPDYSSETASLHNIGLIELDSDVDYAHDLYPVCLYTSQLNPKILKNRYSELQIVADTECGKKYTSTEVCVRNLKHGSVSSGEPIYVEETEFPIYKLFGLVGKKSYDRKPYWIGKVFDHLDFIESIVWPRNDY